MEPPPRTTALFAKHPTPGLVKTRLCPPLAPEGAARLAEAMLRDGVARCLAGDFTTVLVFAPAEAAPWFRATFPQVADQRAQVGPDLGRRLAHFASEFFARAPHSSLVVVGSDQPLVPLARLEEAHRALEDGAECVLGPDTGGGYYLIGLTRSVPELFTAVPMSSAGMLAATRGVARACGLAMAELPEHPDVDTPLDLERLLGELAQPRTRSHPHLDHTRRALTALALFAP